MTPGLSQILRTSKVTGPQARISARRVWLDCSKGWDELSPEECGLAIDTFASIVASAVWACSGNRPEVWACRQKAKRQMGDPFIWLGWMLTKDWYQLRNGAQIEEMIKQTCSHLSTDALIAFEVNTTKARRADLLKRIRESEPLGDVLAESQPWIKNIHVPASEALEIEVLTTIENERELLDVYSNVCRNVNLRMAIDV